MVNTMGAGELGGPVGRAVVDHQSLDGIETGHLAL
jgi:hypothetical protein